MDFLFFVISISGRRNYHYLLSGLVLEETWDSKVAEFGAINITGFRNRHLDNILVELRFLRSFSGKISRYNSDKEENPII
jgi:hypothetical protein